MKARLPSPAGSTILANASSTSARLVVLPAARSAPSCATVHMGGNDSMRARLARLVFGGTCFVCRGTARAVLCERCDADLPRLREAVCPRCALDSPSGALCGRCLTQPPQYDATVAALAYRFPADVLVHALKFRGELALAPFLSSLLRERIGKPAADCI